MKHDSIGCVKCNSPVGLKNLGPCLVQYKHKPKCFKVLKTELLHVQCSI